VLLTREQQRRSETNFTPDASSSEDVLPRAWYRSVIVDLFATRRTDAVLREIQLDYAPANKTGQSG
jgi:hypothetical protein